MKFKIYAERTSGEKATFFYDNETNTLSAEDGFVFQNGYTAGGQNAVVFSPDEPIRKSRQVRMLKIQLGLSCNYSCDYCSQRFVPHADETNKHDIPKFMQMLENLEFSEETGLKIEMWGGEPFVYWKTMKPLTAALKEKFKDWKTPPRFSVITNGSILTEEICDWLVENEFSMAISHDGPGQHVRGPDPFDDPAQKKIILDLYWRLKPLNRISFNSMMNGTNVSRREISQWFVDLTGDPSILLGEGGIVDAYDEGGMQNSLNTKQKHFEFRRTAFNDLYAHHEEVRFRTQIQRVDDFTHDVLSQKHTRMLAQKCGMDLPDTLAVNLHGEVTTCQNVSSAAINSNGEAHLSGSITDMDNVKITTSTHWSKRPNCSSCPVVSICKGACMFLSDKFWDTSCENAYSDAIWVFAGSFEKITGFIPVFIEAEGLPDHRKDIWGTLLEHKEAPVKRVIPISIVNEKTVINDVEVYTPSKVVAEV